MLMPDLQEPDRRRATIFGCDFGLVDLGSQANISFATCPCTLVSRKLKPLNL